MDKWDKKEQDKDELFSMIKEFLPRFLDKQDERPLNKIILQVTNDEMKKIAEVLNK